MLSESCIRHTLERGEIAGGVRSCRELIILQKHIEVDNAFGVNDIFHAFLLLDYPRNEATCFYLDCRLTLIH